MDYNFEKNMVTIFGKNEKLDTLANKLSSLSGEQVYSLFENRGIAIPRKMNCMALTSVINERLKTLHASELSKDYFQRLNYYKEFSEVQLYNLFNAICTTKEEFKLYRINLFKLIIINFVGLNLTDGELKYLKDLKKLPMESFEDYFQFISSMCQEQENTFDGQDMNQLRDMLVNSASNQEIIDLGKKYGIELSSSLKKTDFVEYIKHYLNHAGELSKALEYEIDSSTVSGLNTLCKKYRIPMSSNMSKNELVTYLFYILSQCEIMNTSVRRIETMDIFEPLEFTVDMTAFRGFQRDDTKRIIIYKGMENDEFPILEPKVEEKEELENSLVENPNDLEENVKFEQESIEEASEGEVIYVDEQGNPVDVVFEDDIVEQPLAQESMDLIEETQVENEEIENDSLENIEKPVVEAQEETKKQEEQPLIIEKIKELPKEENTSKNENGLPMDDVRENKEYGNDKLMKTAKGPAKAIILTILGIAIVGIIAFVLWALLK